LRGYVQRKFAVFLMSSDKVGFALCRAAIAKMAPQVMS